MKRKVTRRLGSCALLSAVWLLHCAPVLARFEVDTAFRNATETGRTIAGTHNAGHDDSGILTGGGFIAQAPVRSPHFPCAASALWRKGFGDPSGGLNDIPAVCGASASTPVDVRVTEALAPEADGDIDHVASSASATHNRIAARVAGPGGPEKREGDFGSRPQRPANQGSDPTAPHL